MKYAILLSFFALIIAFSGSSCKSKSHSKSDGSDSTKGFISNVFVSDDNPLPMNDVSNKQVMPPGEWSEALSMAAAQSYQRSDNTPDEFAKAVLYKAIRMVYTDEYNSSKVKVASSVENNGRYTINLKISWADRWVAAPYNMDGVLEVDSNGSNGQFKIINRNLEVESLEFTNDNYHLSKQFDSL